MVPIYPSSIGYFQHEHAPFHKAKVKLEHHEHYNEFSVIQWSFQSPYLYVAQQEKVHLKNVQETYDIIQSCQHRTEPQRNVVDI